MNAAGECRPPERISALPCLPCGRSLRSCRQKVRAVFFGAPQDVPNRQGGKGSVGGPCCRRGPQVLPSRYGVPLLTVRSVRRSFPLPRNAPRFSGRAFRRVFSRTGAVAARIPPRFFCPGTPRGFHTSPSSRKGASAAESLFPAYMPCCLREPMGIHEGVPGI